MPLPRNRSWCLLLQTRKCHASDPPCGGPYCPGSVSTAELHFPRSCPSCRQQVSCDGICAKDWPFGLNSGGQSWCQSSGGQGCGGSALQFDVVSAHLCFPSQALMSRKHLVPPNPCQHPLLEKPTCGNGYLERFEIRRPHGLRRWVGCHLLGVRCPSVPWVAYGQCPGQRDDPHVKRLAGGES